jgi:hypothetical protein
MAIDKNNYVGQVEGGELASVRVANFEKPDVGSRSRSCFGGVFAFHKLRKPPSTHVVDSANGMVGPCLAPRTPERPLRRHPTPLLPSQAIWSPLLQKRRGAKREKGREKTQEIGGDHRVFLWAECYFVISNAFLSGLLSSRP